MAPRKPIIDSAHDVIIKTLVNDVHFGSPHQVHGLKAGLVVNLTKDWFDGDIPASRTAADILIKLGQVEPADGTSMIQAKKRGEEAQAKANAESQKARASAALSDFDSLPSELRQIVSEYGDDVMLEIVNLFQSGESIADIVRAYQKN